MMRLDNNDNHRTYLNDSAIYPSVYFETSALFHSLFKRSPLIFLLALCLASPSALADIKPYKAYYSATFDAGLSIDGDAIRELVKTKNGWRLQQKAENFIASVEETSEFILKDAYIQPQNYEYRHKVMGKKRHAFLDFDWDNKKVLNDVQDQPWTLKIKPNTLDKLSYQLQMRLDLAAGKKHFNYVVADGGSLKNYRFKVVGEETLETALGTIPTTKLERVYPEGKKKETEIWLAKDMDFLLVKIIQTNKQGNETELVLKRLEHN